MVSLNKFIVAFWLDTIFDFLQGSLQFSFSLYFRCTVERFTAKTLFKFVAANFFYLLELVTFLVVGAGIFTHFSNFR